MYKLSGKKIVNHVLFIYILSCIRTGKQHDDTMNNFGVAFTQVDVDAKTREKRGVTACLITGTGPCSGDGNCCSKKCVNNMCCYSNGTCTMGEQNRG